MAERYEHGAIEEEVNLPEQARGMYENVYLNAIRLFGRDEESARRMAWAAVDRFYQRREDGSWTHR